MMIVVYTSVAIRTSCDSNGITKPSRRKIMSYAIFFYFLYAGRRTKFNILTDTVTRLSIQIEIRGPNNEVRANGLWVYTVHCTGAQ